MNIILAGFSGTGKTTVGRRVAHMLGWEFADLDELIVQRSSKSIDDLFAQEGETKFRAREQQILKELCEKENIVLSTGGGAIVDGWNRDLMLKSGMVICLDAQPETIHNRLSEQDASLDSSAQLVRPLLGQGIDGRLERIAKLKAKREWAYALAHRTISSEHLSLEQVASEVLRTWRRVSPTIERYKDPNIAATVITESNSYPIVVGWEILEDQLSARMIALGLKGRAYIICDDNVRPYGRAAQRSLNEAGIESNLFTFPPGEKSKTLTTAIKLYEWLAECKAERGDTIVAVGGGVTGDLAGFVAATYMRGIAYVYVPTTLLAMVDASIGGKTAVDLTGIKNIVGVFHPPRLVIADCAALQSLSSRVLLEGWVEAIKHGLIFDVDLVKIYEDNVTELLSLNPDVCTDVVRRNVAIKAKVVTDDERDLTGLRTLLNYGHTIGHAIETSSGHDRYLHGEAVAIGMMGAAMLGVRVGITPTEVFQRQQELLRRFKLPPIIEGVDVATIQASMYHDKKRMNGDQMWVLLEDIGRATIRGGIPVDFVNTTLKELLRS